MTVTHIFHDPFGHTEVALIVADEAEKGGTEGLKDRVTTRVREAIYNNPLPERVRTWIHQYCLSVTCPKAANTNFEGKLATPIDLSSLSSR